MDIINVTKIKHFNYLRPKWIALSVPKNCNVFCWDVASNLDSRLICQCHIRPRSQSLKTNVLPHLHLQCCMLTLAPLRAFWKKLQPLSLKFIWQNITPSIKLSSLQNQGTVWPKQVHLSVICALVTYRADLLCKGYIFVLHGKLLYIHRINFKQASKQAFLQLRPA